MNEDQSARLPLKEVPLASNIYHDNVAALNLGESNVKEQWLWEDWRNLQLCSRHWKGCQVDWEDQGLSVDRNWFQASQACCRYTLSFSTEAIANRLKCSSNCSNNTKEKKDAQQAHSKLSKWKRHEDEQRMFILQRIMKDNPCGALMAELKAVKESFAKSTSLGGIVEDEHALLPRKQPSGEEEVRIPRPANGHFYTRRRRLLMSSIEYIHRHWESKCWWQTNLFE